MIEQQIIKDIKKKLRKEKKQRHLEKKERLMKHMDSKEYKEFMKWKNESAEKKELR
jgi:hypothetical protein